MPAKLIARKREHQPAAEQEQAAPVAQRPRPEADEVEPVETGRPYQAFVESEARKYWQDMVEPGSLVKPTKREIRAAARPEADEVEPVETGRPYQAFVESEARKYWQDMVKSTAW